MKAIMSPYRTEGVVVVVVCVRTRTFASQLLQGCPINKGPT